MLPTCLGRRFIVELVSGERLIVEIKGQLGDAEVKARAVAIQRQIGWMLC